MLDLCSGMGGFSRAFRERGHTVLTLDYNPKFFADFIVDLIEWDCLEAGDIDVVVASPDCRLMSLAGKTRGNWEKMPDGHIRPITDEAKQSVELVRAVLQTIRNLRPQLYFIENPTAIMRKLVEMDGYSLHTITQCRYGRKVMKKTDIWTNSQLWISRPRCRNGGWGIVWYGGVEWVLDEVGRPCHERAVRGSRTGTQGLKGHDERAVLPFALSLELCRVSEIEMKRRAVE